MAYFMVSGVITSNLMLCALSCRPVSESQWVSLCWHMLLLPSSIMAGSPLRPGVEQWQCGCVLRKCCVCIPAGTLAILTVCHYLQRDTVCTTYIIPWPLPSRSFSLLPLHTAYTLYTMGMRLVLLVHRMDHHIISRKWWNSFSSMLLILCCYWGVQRHRGTHSWLFPISFAYTQCSCLWFVV
jgi:hypothetical protein